MTREQQIEAALKLLAPEPAQRDRCQRDIAAALEQITRNASLGAIGSKKYKQALVRLQAALKRADSARRELPGPVPSELDLDLNPLIEFCEQQIATPRDRRGRRTANPKYHAVWQAQSLLKQWSRARLSKTRGGKWTRLAAILYGDRTADLFRDVQRFRPFILSQFRPKSGFK